jgi:hypothetical protein
VAEKVEVTQAQQVMAAQVVVVVAGLCEPQQAQETLEVILHQKEITAAPMQLTALALIRAVAVVVAVPVLLELLVVQILAVQAEQEAMPLHLGLALLVLVAILATMQAVVEVVL